MLLYEIRVRDELTRLKNYADSVQSKFSAGVGVKDLLIETENLGALWEATKSILPKPIQGVSNIGRHLSWMKRRLREGAPDKCKTDIDDIVNYDIPTIEVNFVGWLEAKAHFDAELIDKTGELVARHELDSAVRKAFVILTERIRKHFRVKKKLDGIDLVNHIFGSSSNLVLQMDPYLTQSWRDLLAGIYGLYRNKYAHTDEEVPWHEAEAILSMINTALKGIDDIELEK